jgi:hypothetical protein
MAALVAVGTFDIDRVAATATAWTDFVVPEKFRRVTIRNETVVGAGTNRVRLGSPTLAASAAFASTDNHVDLGPAESITILLGGGQALASLRERTLKISVDTNPTNVSFTMETGP